MTVQNIPPTAPADLLPWWRKIGYGVGDIYGGGAHIILGAFYLRFLTDVVQLDPGWAGTIILLSKGYDAITDPLEGIITDRTRTRFGRRRPYLVAGILLIFISFLAVFYPFTADSQVTRFALSLLAYLFFSTVFSIVKVNYDALQSEMTLDYNERSQLSGVRIFFSSLAAIVCTVLPMKIVSLAPSVYAGYVAMGVFFGLFFALPYIIVVLTVREREEFQKPPQPFNLRNAFVVPFQMKAFVYMLGLYLFSFMASDIVITGFAYFIVNYLGRPDTQVGYVMGALLVVQVATIPFYVWFSRRTSKRRSFMVGVVIMIIALILSWFLSPQQPAWVVYAFAAFAGMGSSGIIVMVYAMLPDIPDIDELQSGERREGMYYALTGFARKLSNALAAFVVAQAIAIGGYIAPIADQAGALIQQEQSATFILVLRLSFSILPISAAVLSLVMAAQYPLNGELHGRLKDLLAQRRAGEDETPEMAAETEELRQALIG